MFRIKVETWQTKFNTIINIFTLYMWEFFFMFIKFIESF